MSALFNSIPVVFWIGIVAVLGWMVYQNRGVLFNWATEPEGEVYFEPNASDDRERAVQSCMELMELFHSHIPKDKRELLAKVFDKHLEEGGRVVDAYRVLSRIVWPAIPALHDDEETIDE